MPNKSDYYRHVDPVTLSPKTVNPWRNPMKTGIVRAANTYDPNEAIAYKYGPGFKANFSNYPATSVNWQADDQGIGNTDGAYWGVFNRWDVTPGVKRISQLKAFLLYSKPANATAVYIEIWRDDTTEYTLVGTSESLTPPADDYGTALTPASPIAVTIEADKIYYVGLRIVRNTSQAAGPICYTTTGLTFAYNHLRYAMKAGSWNGSTISKTDSANNLYTYNATASGLLMQIVYTSDSYIEQDIATPAAGTYWLAYSETQPHIVKLEGTVVADSEALTAVTADLNGAGETTARSTTEFDCGDTTPGQNDMIYWGETVNLPDIDPEGATGSTGQEGKTFDVWWGYRLPSAFREDLYWQNRTLENAIHSHSVAATATRGTLRASGTVMPAFVTFSGTFTVAKCRVGVRPVMLVGDSQTISGSGDTLRTLNTDALGGLPTSLTKPRIWILHGKAGMTISTMVEAILRSTTPGAADGSEMSGTYSMDAVWCISGIGINDIQMSGDGSDVLVTDKVNTLIAYYADVIRYLGTDDVVIVGLPPSNGATISQYEAEAVRLLNRGLLGLALMNRAMFYNPWLDIVDPATIGDSIPQMLAAYTSDSGTHYSAAGGAVVRPKVVAAIENATIDLRDAWN